MPAYLRAVIDGGWAAAGETFSCGLNFTAPGAAPTQAGMSGWADAVMSYLGSAATEVTQLRGSLTTGGAITRVRTYYYADVNAPASLAGVSTIAATPGAGSPTMPLQCARVYTLQTGIPGRSFRGRLYWPNVSGVVGSTFTSSSVNQSMADNFATFLESVSLTAPSSPASLPAVVSLTQGLVTPVTSIRVGNVIDTQRRRRDNVLETFFAAPIG